MVLKGPARSEQVEWPQTGVADAERESETAQGTLLHVLFRMTRLRPLEVDACGIRTARTVRHRREERRLMRGKDLQVRQHGPIGGAERRRRRFQFGPHPEGGVGNGTGLHADAPQADRRFPNEVLGRIKPLSRTEADGTPVRALDLDVVDVVDFRMIEPDPQPEPRLGDVELVGPRFATLRAFDIGAVPENRLTTSQRQSIALAGGSRKGEGQQKDRDQTAAHR